MKRKPPRKIRNGDIVYLDNFKIERIFQDGKKINQVLDGMYKIDDSYTCDSISGRKKRIYILDDYNSTVFYSFILLNILKHCLKLDN